MYDWTQTPKNLTIKISIPYKIDAKKFESQVTDSYLKINILDPKIFRFIDFYDYIDFKTAKIVIEDKNIVIFITKLNESTWPHIESKLPKDELIVRRKISDENFNIEIEKNKLKAKETKKDLEKFVFNKSMQITEEKRKELRDKKNLEKTNMETELYDFVKSYDNKKDLNENNNIKNALPSKETENADTKKENIEKLENTKIQNKKVENKIEDKYNISNENNKIQKIENNLKSNNNLNNEIFDDITIEKNQVQIRQETKMNVNLTEKEIPHFAARESLSKDPPYPKWKKFVPEKNHVIIYI
jgi:hypothetical protein